MLIAKPLLLSTSVSIFFAGGDEVPGKREK